MEQLKTELEHYEIVYFKLRGMRNDNCKLPQMEKELGAVIEVAWVSNAEKFSCLHSQLLGSEEKIEKMTIEFVNQLAKSRPELKRLRIELLEHKMKNPEIGELEEEMTDLLSLEVKPLTTIDRLCNQFDDLIWAGRNNLQTRSVNGDESEDLQDDCKLDREIRGKVHDVGSFRGLNEENIHNLLVKPGTMNSEIMFREVKRMKVEAPKDQNANERSRHMNKNQSEASQLLCSQAAKIEKLERDKASLIGLSENLMFKLHSTKSTGDSETVLLQSQISSFNDDEQLKDLEMELRTLKLNSSENADELRRIVAKPDKNKNKAQREMTNYMDFDNDLTLLARKPNPTFPNSQLEVEVLNMAPEKNDGILDTTLDEIRGLILGDKSLEECSD